MSETKSIDLALQGGGAHGAFTWGVLDRFLEDDRIRIEAISGTSAGAMNAVVVADGLDRGGREGAIKALRTFWRGVSDAGAFSPMQRTFFDRMFGRWTLDWSPGYIMADLMTRLVSPYQMNPLDVNPVRMIVTKLIDFEHVRDATGIKIFVAATNVRTGKLKIFNRGEMTADMVLASACLPYMFQAVEIDGEAYWDGGFMGNPSLVPLVEECESRDIVIVQINPVQRDTIPRTAHDILNRVNEITFNASLMKDIRYVAQLIKHFKNAGPDNELRGELLFHRVNADEELKSLGVSSKFNTEWAFMEHLHDVGHRITSSWLDANYHSLGNHSTLDVDSVYLQS